MTSCERANERRVNWYFSRLHVAGESTKDVERTREHDVEVVLTSK